MTQLIETDSEAGNVIGDNEAVMPNPEAEMTLDELREQIDACDEELVGLVARRMRLAVLAGERKRAAGLPMRNIGREVQVVARVGNMAIDQGMHEKIAHDVWSGVLIPAANRLQRQRNIGKPALEAAATEE